MQRLIGKILIIGGIEDATDDVTDDQMLTLCVQGLAQLYGSDVKGTEPTAWNPGIRCLS